MADAWRNIGEVTTNIVECDESVFHRFKLTCIGTRRRVAAFVKMWGRVFSEGSPRLNK